MPNLKYPIGTVFSFSDERDGQTYHGKLVKIIESNTGVRIKLTFKDGTSYPVDLDICTKTELGADNVSVIGPAGSA